MLVVGDFLVERGADALRDAALHLAVDDHRIDHRAAVLRHDIVEDLDDAGVGLDRDDDGVGAVGKHAAGLRRLVGARWHRAADPCRPAGAPGGRSAAKAISAKLTLPDGPCTAPASMRVSGDVGLQQMRADALDLFEQHPARPGHRAAGKHDRARAEACRTRTAPSRCRRSGWKCARDRSSAHARRSARTCVSWPWP